MDKLTNENENVKVTLEIKTNLTYSDKELLNQAKDLIDSILEGNKFIEKKENE